MKLRLLLPLFFLSVIPVTGQVEHAPTPEQCKADADAWGIPNPAPILFLFHLDDFAKMNLYAA